MASVDLDNGWTVAIVGGSVAVSTSNSPDATGLYLGGFIGAPCFMASAIGPVTITMIN